MGELRKEMLLLFALIVCVTARLRAERDYVPFEWSDSESYFCPGVGALEYNKEKVGTFERIGRTTYAKILRTANGALQERARKAVRGFKRADCCLFESMEGDGPDLTGDIMCAPFAAPGSVPVRTNSHGYHCPGSMAGLVFTEHVGDFYYEGGVTYASITNKDAQMIQRARKTVKGDEAQECCLEEDLSAEEHMHGRIICNPESPNPGLRDGEQCRISALVIDEDPAGLNVRAKPTSRSAKVGVPLPADTVVKVDAASGAWMHIYFAENGETFESIDGFRPGWVFSGLLGVHTSDSEKKLYSEPSAASSVVHRINGRAKLQSCHKDWAKVKLGDASGYLAPSDWCASAVTNCS